MKPSLNRRFAVLRPPGTDALRFARRLCCWLALAACCLGVGAARVNGHFEQAWPLTSEMLATSWPLPDGTRLFPGLLSNATDAPYLGEAAILFNLTRLPVGGVAVKTGGSLPNFVLIFLAVQLGAGLILLFAALRSLRAWRQHRESIFVIAPRAQFGIWVGLLLAGIVCLWYGQATAALLLFVATQLFPKYRESRPAPSAAGNA